MPTLRHKNIRGFDVPVNDAFGVFAASSPSGNINRNRQKFFKFHRTARNGVLQGLSVQKLHGDEGFAGFFADVVNRANVGMIQCRSGFGLTPKAFERLRVAG
jgi:hypothetical protein